MQNVVIENHNSRLKLNLEKGGQIQELLLKDPFSNRKISVILPYNEKDNFFLSGNFLLFPWVNRLQSSQVDTASKSISIQPIEKDPQGYPIHGLYFNTERKLVELKKNFVKIEPIATNNDFPQFAESFSLEENSLRIRTEFFNPTDHIQQFAYGYHPYLRLDANLEGCFLHTNLTDYIPLTSTSLPNPNLEKRNITELFSSNNPIGNLKLDHLLTGNEKETFLGIADPQKNTALQIRVSANSQIPLPYFQIYTPEARSSIAIEPMSATGNAFFIQNSGLHRLNPNERIFGEFFIELVGANS